MVVSIYSFLCVILEYPTGVIGDYFSHKVAVTISSLTTILMFLLSSFSGDLYFYIIVGAVFPAFAYTMHSGSDVAFMHSVSKDFKKDMAQIAPIALVLSAINIGIGGWLGSIDLRYPLYASSVYAVISLFFLFTTKAKGYKNEDGDVFSIALGGIKEVFSNRKLLDLIIVSAAFTSFGLSIKWFYNPLFESIKIPIWMWGIITSIAFLFVAVGAHIYRKNSSYPLKFVSGISLIAILFIGLTSNYLLPVLGIWLFHVVRGYQDTSIGVEMNNLITSRRASILSFSSLVSRLGSATYTAIVSFALPRTSFLFITSITSLLLFLIIYKPLYKTTISKK